MKHGDVGKGNAVSEGKKLAIGSTAFGEPRGRGIRLAEFFLTKKVDVLYTRETFEGKGPESFFPMRVLKCGKPV